MDVQDFLKESGYLDSPTRRLFPRGATPTLRGHLRLLATLTAIGSIPLALLLALLSDLKGSDRLVLFLFYLFGSALAFVLLDVVLALLLKLRAVQKLAVGGQLLNVLPAVLTGLFFGFGIYALAPALERGPYISRLISMAALGFTAFLLAMPPRYLIITRLYWHGVHPPTYRAYRPLTVLTMVAIVALYLGGGLFAPKPPVLVPRDAKPLVLLAFDLPPDQAHHYEAVFPPWPTHAWQGEPGSITDFWASLATGTPNRVHRSSLWAMQSPLFLGKLSREDPTQRLPIRLLAQMDLLEPVAGGGRYRKYFWEILDTYGLTTYSFSYWHTFPAHTGHGGVLSERWRPGRDERPYLAGIETFPSRKVLDVSNLRPLKAMAAREDQSWRQLISNLDGLNFHAAIAYFPLSDNLAHLSFQESAHRELAAYRQEQLKNLLEVLGDDIAVGIVLASGKSNEAAIKARLLCNEAMDQILAERLEEPAHLAPAILNYFGLPTDKLMYPIPVSLPTSARVDYGEPELIRVPNDQRDTRYYQELRALGYIR